MARARDEPGVTACEVCGTRAAHRTFVAREMMFGWREPFTYMQCSECGCLANTTVPADLGRFYGNGYYSMAGAAVTRRPLRDRLKALRTEAHLGDRGWFGRLLLARWGPPQLPAWVLRAGVRQDSRLLEVGCGGGQLLRQMRTEGFHRLTGIDPFIEADIDHGDGLVVRKRRIDEENGRYEFVVLEHSFEHIPDPHRTMRDLLRLLAPGGTLIVSLPIAAWAWKHYGVNWVQLDAPRHLYLHTERSFRLLCEGLASVEVEYDSGPVQFWGSEQYARDIPLLDPRSHRVNPGADLFTREQMNEFERRAAELNAIGQGDQATFYIRPNGGQA